MIHRQENENIRILKEETVWQNCAKQRNRLLVQPAVNEPYFSSMVL